MEIKAPTQRVNDGVINELCLRLFYCNENSIMVRFVSVDDLNQALFYKNQKNSINGGEHKE